MVWLLHILFVLEGIVIVLEGTLTSDPEADVNAIMSQSQFSRVGINSILFSLFLAPNFLSVFFYQLAMVAIVIFSAVMNDATDKDTVKENIMIPRHVPQLVCFLLFFLLQKRELKRFFDKQVSDNGWKKAEQGQKELTHVLDSQSASILVVDQAAFESNSPTGQASSNSIGSKPVFSACLYSNKRSESLLGLAITQKDPTYDA